MANPILESVATDLVTITDQLTEAQELLSVLKEAGEDTTKMESDIRTLEIRKKKWERVLKARGVEIKK